MNAEIEHQLETAITSGAPLPAILDRLRTYRAEGVARGEVQAFLEGMRVKAADEAIEDRILEVLDFVSGFCSRENTIWPD